MPTLAETIAQSRAETSQKVLHRVKPASSFALSASVSKKSEEFHLVRVRVSKLPMLFASGAKTDGPLVIDKNYYNVGRVASDYIPHSIILAGRNTLKNAKALGEEYVNAWVGTGALKPLRIMASDCISNSALEDKLRNLIREAYGPKKRAANAPYADAYYDSIPYIQDIYQGDSYLIFRAGKSLWRQNFSIDNKTRNVTLVGSKIEVIVTYTTAPNGDISSSIKAWGPKGYVAAPVSPSIAKPTWNTDSTVRSEAPAHGGFNGPNATNYTTDFVNYGGVNSELNNPQYKLMTNVEEALALYLEMVKNGIHKPVSMMGLVTPPSYLNAARETKIALKAAADVPATFSLMDFFHWQDKTLSIKASAQTKLVNGEVMTSEDFAYIGDKQDISTWRLPIASKSHVLSSMKASMDGIPKFERAEVKDTLRRVAQEFNISAKK